ncbi:MAG TPA: hypothetical protein PLZ86_01770 [bacterium]|nr:hypothetical protein [bacterium]
MKNTHMLSFLITACLLAAASASFGSAGSPKPPADFENSPAWAKLDLRAREAWRTGTKGDAKAADLECFIKTTRDATADDKAILARAGFKARTTAGSIMTGSVAAEDVPAVASLDFVQAMELAVPLSPKDRR